MLSAWNSIRSIVSALCCSACLIKVLLYGESTFFHSNPMCEDTLPCLTETEVGVSELGTVVLLFKERGKSDQI